jgi:hypothetical protein
MIKIRAIIKRQMKLLAAIIMESTPTLDAVLTAQFNPKTG